MAPLVLFKEEAVLLSYRNTTGNCVGRHKTPPLCWKMGRPFGNYAKLEEFHHFARNPLANLTGQTGIVRARVGELNAVLARLTAWRLASPKQEVLT